MAVSKKQRSSKPKKNPLLQHRSEKDAAKEAAKKLHIYNNGVVCSTDTRGYPTPENRSPTAIVVDASDGFIPLWDSDVTLRWRFNELALEQFLNIEEIKNYMRELFGEGVLEWGDAVPIEFSEREDAWDFEIVIHAEERCTVNGCTLATAFFPDAGRHELNIYPTMFEQSRKEQIETMAHELGHVFGLRHFFADVRESAFPSEIFGEHETFSIMNYGADSGMTDADRSDLKALYESAREKTLKRINGTPIRLVQPFSANRIPTPEFQLIAARQG